MHGRSRRQAESIMYVRHCRDTAANVLTECNKLPQQMEQHPQPRQALSSWGHPPQRNAYWPDSCSPLWRGLLLGKTQNHLTRKMSQNINPVTTAKLIPPQSTSVLCLYKVGRVLDYTWYSANIIPHRFQVMCNVHQFCQ